MLSNHLILCCPLLLPPSMFPSIRVFSNESPLHTRWPKYWSFSFDISPSIDYPELISFSMDWLDPLTMQGILKSLLQHHSSKASILWCSVFFTVQLSYPYMTTGKTIDWLDGHFLTKQCLCFLICCLVWSSLSFPRSKCLLISWLQSSAMILAPPEIKFRLWTLWERVNMGWFESISLKHGYHHMWNRLPVQEVPETQHSGLVLWDNPAGWVGVGGGEFGIGTHVHPWLIHVNAWKKPLRYCTVISLQLK